MLYIGLLRGINVGGNHRVPMSELKELFSRWGCTRVETLLNSGNIIYEWESPLADNEIAEQLAKHFDFPIPYLSIAFQKYEHLMEQAPSWWGKNPDYRHNIIFLLNSYTHTAVWSELGAPHPEHEQVAEGNGALFWSSAFKNRQHYYQTKSAKIVGSKAYKNFTIRNHNTALKLLTRGREMKDHNRTN